MTYLDELNYIQACLFILVTMLAMAMLHRKAPASFEGTLFLMSLLEIHVTKNVSLHSDIFLPCSEGATVNRHSYSYIIFPVIDFNKLTSKFAPLAGERGVLDLGEDGVVHPRLAGDAVAQPVQRIVA